MTILDAELHKAFQREFPKDLVGTTEGIRSEFDGERIEAEKLAGKKWLNRDPHWERGFMLLRWGTLGVPARGEQNLYAFLGNSAINLEDSYGLSVWSKCKDYCHKLFDTAKDKAKDKIKDTISDKLKEWFADQAGGQSVDQARADCDSLKNCPDPGPSNAKWGGNCLTCAVYKCALESATGDAANSCLKAKLIGCEAGVEP